jgi:hypothetical protein
MIALEDPLLDEMTISGGTEVKYSQHCHNRKSR